MRTLNCITAILATLVLGSCGVPKNKFRLDGKFKNIHSADIFIFSEEKFDTLHVRSGSFSYEKELGEPEILTLQYPDFSQRIIIAEPGKKAKFRTDAADLGKTRVTGTDENELLTQFYNDINSRHGGGITETAETFIRQNPATLAAQAVFERFILDSKDIDGPRAGSLLSLMVKAQPNNMRLSQLAGRITPTLATQPGARIPDFKVNTYEGREITPATFRGKYLLISYWASWQYDSFQQIRGLKNLTKPFAGRLQLVNVSLDYDIRSFRNTMTRDTLPGYNICDRQAWQSPLVKLFGISFVPGNVLVSPEGKILMRDIRSADLKPRLAKYIKI